MSMTGVHPPFLSYLKNPETQDSCVPGFRKSWSSVCRMPSLSTFPSYPKQMDKSSSTLPISGTVSSLHDLVFDLRLVLVLSNSQILRAPFYPMRQWFQRKNTQQYVAVAQREELVNLYWASVLLLPLFLIPFSRCVLNASFHPMPFDG